MRNKKQGFPEDPCLNLFQYLPETFWQPYVGEWEDGVEHGGDIGGGVAGDAAADRGDEEGQFGVVAGVVDEAADGGAGAFQALHGRDGIGLALEAFANTPDGPETLHRDTGRSAHMASRLIAPEYENLAGIKLKNQWRSGPGYHLSGKQKVNRMCVCDCHRLAVYGAAFPFWRGRHYPYSFGIQRFANSFNHLYVFD